MRTTYQIAHFALDTMKVSVEDSWSGTEAPTFSITATCQDGERSFESGCHVTVSAKNAVTRFWDGEGSRRFYGRRERHAYRPLRRQVESWIDAVVDTLDILLEGQNTVFLDQFQSQLSVFRNYVSGTGKGPLVTETSGATRLEENDLIQELAMFRLNMASLAYFYRIGKVDQSQAFPLLQDAHAVMNDLLALPDGLIGKDLYLKACETKKHLASITSLNKFLREKTIA